MASNSPADAAIIQCFAACSMFPDLTPYSYGQSCYFVSSHHRRGLVIVVELELGILNLPCLPCLPCLPSPEAVCNTTVWYVFLGYFLHKYNTVCAAEFRGVPDIVRRFHRASGQPSSVRQGRTRIYLSYYLKQRSLDRVEDGNYAP